MVLGIMSKTLGLSWVAVDPRCMLMSLQAKLALGKAIKADKTFEKAVVSLSSILVHEGNVERAADM